MEAWRTYLAGMLIYGCQPGQAFSKLHCPKLQLATNVYQKDILTKMAYNP